MADPTTDITDEEIDALLAEVTEEIDDSKEKKKLTANEKIVPEVDVNKQVHKYATTTPENSVESKLETNDGVKNTSAKQQQIIIEEGPALREGVINLDIAADKQSDVVRLNIATEDKSAVVSLNIATEEKSAVVTSNTVTTRADNGDAIVETKQESHFHDPQQPVLEKGTTISELQKDGLLSSAGEKVNTGDMTVLKKKVSSTSNDGIIIKKKPGAAAVVSAGAVVSGGGVDAIVAPETTSATQAAVDFVMPKSNAIRSADAKMASTPVQVISIPTSPKVVKSHVISSEDMLAVADGILSDKKIQDGETRKKKYAQKTLGNKNAAKDEFELECNSGKPGVSSDAARRSGSGEKLDKSKISEAVAQTTASPTTSSWGWSSISSWSSAVLSSATSLTSQVGGSMYQVLEAVESSLVEPEVVISAEQLHQMNRESRTKKKLETIDSEEFLRREAPPRSVTAPAISSIDRASTLDGGHLADSSADINSTSAHSSTAATSEASWFTDWMGLKAIPAAVHKSGKKVVGSSLHVLEAISRKTISIWNTGAEEEQLKETVPGVKSLLMKRFDDCLGLVHFDALKTLSGMSREKLTLQLDMVSADSLHALNADLSLISDAFDLGEMGWELQLSEVDHDFHQLINDYVTRLTLSIKADKLLTLHESITNWLESCRKEAQDGRNCSPEEIHEMAVLMLAELTANSIALYHKIAQLILVDTCTPALAYKLRALCLAGLTKVVCTEVWIQMRHFTEHINKSRKSESNEDDNNLALIQALTVDASNCSTCLQDAFRLILPIMHLALTRVHPLCLENTSIPHLEGLQIISKMSALSVRGQRSAKKKNDETLQRLIRDIASRFDLSHLLTAEGQDESDKASQEQDFRASIATSLGQLGVEKSTEQIVATQARIRQWLADQSQKKDVPTSPSDIHQRATQSLAEFKSGVIEIYHNVAESLLSDQLQGEAVAETVHYRIKVDALTSVTRFFCREVGVQSTQFTSCLTACKAEANLTVEQRNEVSSTVTPFITNIYLEASNCMTCIQDGYQLLLPILQLAVIKQYERPPRKAKITK